jgi:hypothetical protein
MPISRKAIPAFEGIAAARNYQTVEQGKYFESKYRQWLYDQLLSHGVLYADLIHRSEAIGATGTFYILVLARAWAFTESQKCWNVHYGTRILCLRTRNLDFRNTTQHHRSSTTTSSERPPPSRLLRGLQVLEGARNRK